MKRNFLILMLMALLPLAGWAQAVDISAYNIEIGTVAYVYSAGTPTITTTVTPTDVTTPLSSTTDYDVVYYNSEETLITAATVKNVGTYYVAAKGKGTYTGETRKVEFQITPATLTVSITENITKSYGDEAKPEVTFTTSNVSISGWKGSEGTTDRINNIVDNLDFEWTNAQKTANANYDGSSWYDDTAKGTALTFSTAETTNYQYTFSFDGMKVTPVTLTVGTGSKFTYTASGYTKVTTSGGTTTGGYVYNGATQTPTITVTYTDPQDNVKTLKAGTAADYSVAYQYSTTADGTYNSDANTPNSSYAGFYKLNIVATTKGNYTGTVAFPAVFDGETAYYQIRQKDLKINVKDKTKVYDGTAFAAADVEYNTLGLVSADAVTAITDLYTDSSSPAFSYTPSPAFAADAKSYKATPTIDNSKLKTNIQTNYNVVAGNPGYLSITKRPVTVTAVAQSRDIEEADPNLSAKDLDDTDYSSYTSYVTIETTGTDKGLASDTDTEKKDVLAAVSLDLDYTYTGAGTYEDAVKVVIDNTKSKNYTVTGVDGDFTVNGLVLSIYAVDNTKAYGESLDELEYGTSGLIGSLGEGTSIKYTIKKSNGNALASSDYVNGRLKPATYQIILDEDNSTVVLPAEYDGKDIDPTPATLTITTKTIYAIPANVSLNTGDDVDDLNTMGKAAVRFLDSNAQDSEGNYTGSDAIEEGDVISYWLNFNTDVSLDTDKKITNTAKVTNGVKVELITTEPAATEATYEYYVANQNTLYNINVTTTADLLIDGKNIVLDRTAADLLTTLSVADGKTYTVRFANERTLAAQKWYSMVLPFEVSVAKLSNALGYAIVNVVNEDKTSADGVYFKLEMNKIPANTPFLLKAAEAVNLNYIDADGDGTLDEGDNFVQIPDVEITAPAGDVTKTYGGVNFVGVYEHQYLPVGASLYAAGTYYTIETADSNTGDAFMSYWTANAGAPVFVEDITEGGATVIRQINANTEAALAAEGWYTVNGVKLNAAPAQKGVYIKDGKKVVIK